MRAVAFENLEMEYDLEVNRIIEQIKQKQAQRVGLQFPEGLKQKAILVAKEIEENTDSKVIIFTDPSYGACDTKDWQAERLGIDLLIHFGHTRFE